jgi:hypothetical protein
VPKRGLGIAVLACAFSACSLVVDTEGLSDLGAPATPVLDGAVAVDAAADAEAGVAPVDASPEGSASPCAATHLFCDDFDTGTLVGRWDQMETTAGPLTLDAAFFVSPSRSLLGSIQPLPGINTRATALRKVVGVPAKRARLAVDFRTPGPGPGAFEQVDLLSMSLLPPPPGFQVQTVGLFERPSGTEFERYTESPGGFSTSTPVLLARSRWVHVVIEADFSKVPAMASVAMDGVVTATRELAGSDLTGVKITVGPGFVNSANVEWPIAYDNVTVDP